MNTTKLRALLAHRLRVWETEELPEVRMTLRGEEVAALLDRLDKLEAVAEAVAGLSKAARRGVGTPQYWKAFYSCNDALNKLGAGE